MPGAWATAGVRASGPIPLYRECRDASRRSPVRQSATVESPGRGGADRSGEQITVVDSVPPASVPGDRRVEVDVQIRACVPPAQGTPERRRVNLEWCVNPFVSVCHRCPASGLRRRSVGRRTLPTPSETAPTLFPTGPRPPRRQTGLPNAWCSGQSRKRARPIVATRQGERTPNGCCWSWTDARDEPHSRYVVDARGDPSKDTGDLDRSGP